MDDMAEHRERAELPPETPEEWAQKELQRILRRSVRSTNPEEAEEKDVLITGYSLIRKLFDTHQTPTKKDIKLTELGSLDTLACLESMGKLLQKRNNPLAIPFLIASTLDTMNLQETMEGIPDTMPGAPDLRDKTNKLATNGGKVVFPNPTGYGVLMEAQIDITTPDVVSYGSDARSMKPKNDKILFTKGAIQKALAMIQPR